ncbi:MAG: restriction endonuclease [Alphaproteobacteria bacterium]
MQGLLFTQDFLLEGITETEAWRGLPGDELAAFRTRVAEVFARFPVEESPNEATTERNLIDPVLRALGWQDFLVQQSAGPRRESVPDYLLFRNAEAMRVANRRRRDDERYRHGTAIVEAKAWQRPLDRAPGHRGAEPDLFDDGVPSTQMLRYLTRAETASDRRIQWGILTNGRLWRLYFQGARSRTEEFLELDLALLVGAPGVVPDLFAQENTSPDHLLKVFLLAFRRNAFLPEADGRTFHVNALAEGRHWEVRVAEDLSRVVFDDVFPSLVRILTARDPGAPRLPSAEYLEEVRVAALTLLYRLLFVLYAEDRGLLPVREERYRVYALRRIRDDVRERIDSRDAFSHTQERLHSNLKELFRAIHGGDEGIGLPPYNGGLFDPLLHPLLERVTIPDADFAAILDALSRREEGGRRKWINYRDLSVQQLGSIYERLLERAVVQNADEVITVQPDAFARRTTGSYYTHQDLVDLIIKRAVGPLLDERWTAFEAKCNELRSARSPRFQRIADLQHIDAATAFLDIKVCDPAMGSGHFLVSLVDYLADRTLQAVADAEDMVTWADKEAPYRSPLGVRIAEIRRRILENAHAGNWTIDEDQLDDRRIVRRMILKRVIYGVDKNPMAVELAKVALWLHTFTVGAPLSFLDHHLRCGDALFGEWVGQTMADIRRRYGLFVNEYVQRAQNTAAGMQHIEQLTDADIAEAKASSAEFEGIVTATAPLESFLDVRQGLRWLSDSGPLAGFKREAVDGLLSGNFGDPVAIAEGSVTIEVPTVEGAPKADAQHGKAKKATGYDDRTVRIAIVAAVEGSRAIASRERFLHWEVAFPGVWRNWESLEPHGGFDAVIGNPPWDRIKLQEVEWFAGRRRDIATAARASDRKAMIDRLRRRHDPLWRDYEEAKHRAETMANVARSCGDFPLLSAGDINLYALFVERAHRLVKSDGLVGLLTPSGIASDLTASRFFRGIATTGRLAALFDFENRRPGEKHFFPDVDSRFKFCVYVARGEGRRFNHADCAFYLHGVNELDSPERRFALTAADFERINPNTGTAPVFRTRRDAELTKAIYGSAPVLVDRRESPPTFAWPVRYVRMFDMTNDAGLFRTREELQADGFYPVAGNRLLRGDDVFVPLYEGKMVQAYDHRAASVVVNLDNVNRPAQPMPATDDQHADVNWCPAPQFFVSAHESESRVVVFRPTPGNRDSRIIDCAAAWFLAFKDVTAPTNVRTMIAGIIPRTSVGNTLPLLLPSVSLTPHPEAPHEKWQRFEEDVKSQIARYVGIAPLLLANLNAFAYDYFARQKVHGQHLNFFIVEQVPVIAEHSFEQRFGRLTARELVCREVLRLTYTSHEMAPFARDMGNDGPPFQWDAEDRRHRRARLDSVFFHLYGIARDDAAYVLDTFPIVRREDEAAFGRYRTKDLVLGYMNALAAGDTDTVVDA